MLKVGLTGGVGSGKSVISELFAQLGVCIIDADVISHQLAKPGEPGYQAVIEHFKDENMLLVNGTLNRLKLRDIIFNSPLERKWVESTLHPMIREVMKAQLADCDRPYCMLVIPLLTEASNKIEFIDRVLVVDTPVELQIKRVCERNNTSEETAKKMIAAQNTREQRLAKADDVIVNDGDIEQLRPEVIRLNELYLGLKA